MLWLRTTTLPLNSLELGKKADPLLPVAHGRDTAAHLPNVHYEEIAGLGHDLPPRLLPRYVTWIRALINGELAMDNAHGA